MAITSDPGRDNTYGKDDVITISVTFDQAVNVTGAPRIAIDMDPADWGEKQAAYASGSGATTLTFTYTVVQPNESTQGIAVLADTLELNGGTIVPRLPVPQPPTWPTTGLAPRFRPQGGLEKG